MTDSSRVRAVAIGGGTGMPTVLQCFVDCGFDTTAIVTVADDGGSSGILRERLGMLPPGDIRNCLVALAEEPDGPLATLFQHRFSRGEGLAGHALGNLMIAALVEMHGSFAEGVDAAAELLKTRGRVVPSTLVPVTLHATDAAGNPVKGQANIAVSHAPVARVCMDPESPEPYGPALEAIASADLIVVGPGSLFTSIIPNVLVAGIADAVRNSSARRVYVCNVANQRGETQRMDAADHLEALYVHGLTDAIDAVIVHVPDTPVSHTVPGVYHEDADAIDRVGACSDVRDRMTATGVEVIAADLVDPTRPLRHDPARLRVVLAEVL